MSERHAQIAPVATPPVVTAYESRNTAPRVKGNGSPIERLSQKRWLEPVALFIVLLCALALRTYRLTDPFLWCDEAESSMNAMSILDHGIPTNKYLDLPIYENILTEKWPESSEY